MINRIDRKKLASLPRGKIIDGLAFCPMCWRPLVEPIGGRGCVGVYCKQCKAHVLVSFIKK